jgi:2-dehydro-3-deoxygluconokinase
MGEWVNGFVSFGEVMLRLSPPGHTRLLQAHAFDAVYGGGEANVAVALAQFGVKSRFVTAVPTHDIGQTAINSLRGWGVDTSHIVRFGDRLGIYFLEHGASQRPSNVIYDRKGSAISECDPSAFEWHKALAGAQWFHFSGITPALSGSAAKAVKQAADMAKRLGLTVSCDLNYRSKLWSRDQARETMSALMENVDVLFANEEDCEAVFGITGKGSQVASGKIDHGGYADVAGQLVERFGFRAVAITLRESVSASENGWSGMLLQEAETYFSRRYQIEIVDRVGSGDAFAAGVIYAFLKGMPPQDLIEFGAAAGCLKHSVPGDFNIATVAEIEALVKGGGSGRVRR